MIFNMRAKTVQMVQLVECVTLFDLRGMSLSSTCGIVYFKKKFNGKRTGYQHIK